MGSLSVWHWLIVLLVVMLVFGTKKLGSIGSDLGNAIREFKRGVNGVELPLSPSEKLSAEKKNASPS
ncbi:MAG: hypothetical protein H6R04_931 [Burkholderiaceae bacterium]|nr:hypothetical protein [Burkholderiaceae bacterium]